ncbi:hypothetical protein A0H81_03969 [Grifola frondosa]|uniref:AB hydrolase-1 domain-containing protein n=1 Tax=Grifola frondosa TaxID=5627 RepID=A0A1C7MHB2_GRIFR|nr:hypothetical protein A0H81_03969 [Grifola frondosa]
MKVAAPTPNSPMATWSTSWPILVRSSTPQLDRRTSLPLNVDYLRPSAITHNLPAMGDLFDITQSGLPGSEPVPQEKFLPLPVLAVPVASRRSYAKKLYIAGGSMGTVPAQILYGASYDVFPLGRRIVALLLIAPFSPFHHHKRYTHYLPWGNYFAVGPPASLVPFNLIPRAMKIIIQRKLRTLEGATAFVHQFLFSKMDESERETFQKWRHQRGLAEGQLEREIAQGMMRSVSKSWEGFLTMPSVLHSDWGFNPAMLDGEHMRKPMLVVMSRGDDMVPNGMAEYLLENYRNARAIHLEGGHISSIWKADEIWAEFMAMEV